MRGKFVGSSEWSASVSDPIYLVSSITTDSNQTSAVVILENGIETEGILEHEYRALARGLPVYRVFLILTLDDFSGNFTTRWNCHYLVRFSVFLGSL